MDKKLIAMVAIVGVSILGGSMYAMGVSPISTDDLSINGNTGITGHVILTVYDEFGNIKSYTQSDNTITNRGENCIAEYMFGVSTACAAATDFLTIILGTGLVPHTDNVHGTVTTMIDTATQRAASSATVVTSTGALPTDGNSDAEVTIETTFTGNTATYTEVALANGINGDFFAYQDMADATVGDADSVKVTWVITIN